MWASIIALISNFFKAIPDIIKLFTKPTTEKVEGTKQDLDEKEKKFDETGRPQ
jgi:hypothetical protein